MMTLLTHIDDVLSSSFRLHELTVALFEHKAMNRKHVRSTRRRPLRRAHRSFFLLLSVRPCSSSLSFLLSFFSFFFGFSYQEGWLQQRHVDGGSMSSRAVVQVH